MIAVWIILGVLLGGVAAAAATFVLTDRRSRLSLTTARTDLALATDRAAEAQRSLAVVTQSADAARHQLGTEQQARATLAATLSAERENVQRHTATSAAATAVVETLRHQLATLNQDRAALAATLDAERAALAQQREQLAETNTRLRESFAEASTAALKANREDFIAIAEQRFRTLQTEAAGAFDQKKTEMGQLLQPMQQTLEQYRVKLDAIEQSRVEAYVDLKGHLAGVAATQQVLSVETKQLVSALRRPQGRGRWGELTLRRLFELAGLAERVTFHEQVSADEGRMRPDCVVTLPEERQVIVDSKCVLDAFLNAAASTDDAERTGMLVQHARQVRSRVDDLSSKQYQSGFENATDYVILFLPGEAFLHAAMEHDPMLVEYAMKKRVIVASPTTLLGLLRVIEHGWRRRAIEENAQQIRDLGTTLYERIQKVAGDLQRLGSQLSKTTQQYNTAIASIESRVLPAARKMAELGVSGKGEAIGAIEEVADDVKSLNARSWKALLPAEEAALLSAPGT